MPGSTVEKGDCGHDVTLSPSTKEYIATVGREAVSRIICIPCAMSEELPSKLPLKIAPGQLEELTLAIMDDKKVKGH